MIAPIIFKLYPKTPHAINIVQIDNNFSTLFAGVTSKNLILIIFLDFKYTIL